MKKSEIIHMVPFRVLYEIHETKSFQAEGHSIPALRERDAEGNYTRNSRPWGDEVHALTLLGPDGEPAKVTDVNSGKQISMCRALSDNRQEAEELLAINIRETFFASKRALELASFNAMQLQKSTNERTQLVNYMLSHGQRSALADILGEGEAAVEEFQRRESDPNLKSKVDQMLSDKAL